MENFTWHVIGWNKWGEVEHFIPGNKASNEEQAKQVAEQTYPGFQADTAEKMDMDG